MTISFGTAGAQSTHTDTITPAVVGSAGQLAVLQVVSGHPLDSVPSTPSGWTLVGSASGGGGSFGASAGPRRHTFFARILLGGDPNPTTAIPSGSAGSLIIGRIVSLSKTAGTGWRWAVSFGDDQASGTAFSATGTSALTWKAGDYALIGYGVASNADSYTAEAIAVAGVTFGVVTERADNAITTGNGATVALASCSVSSGTATLAPTITATLASASIGIAGVMRVREASSDVNATPQSVFPPRNLVSATGLTGDDIVTISLLRQAGSLLVPVRAASSIDVTGQASFLRVDAEQPFGISVNYAAVLTDVNGTQWTVFSGPITSTVASDVVSDAIRGVGAAVKIESPLEWKRDRDSSQFNINGRIVVVGKPRSSRSGTLTVRTETDDDGDAMNELLDQATEGTILVRKQVSLSRLDGTYSLIDDTESPNWYDEFRWFALNVVKSDDWPDVMEAAGFTLQDIANNFSILSDIAAFFPTNLLAIAQYDFGP
jgi:PIN domain nuclease of toxin-antitoxin system